MCGLQKALAKTKALRFGSLWVRLGMAGSRQVSKRVGQKGRQWRRSLSSTYRTTSGGKGNGSLRKTLERLSSSVSRRANLPDHDTCDVPAHEISSVRQVDALPTFAVKRLKMISEISRLLVNESEGLTLPAVLG